MLQQRISPSSLAALGSLAIAIALITAPPAQANPLSAPTTGSQASSARIATPSLRLGDRGPAVRQLQQMLQANGFLNGEATGVFDRATQAAVREFQTFANLSVDGVAGAATWDALLRMTDPYNVNLTPAS